MTNDDGVEVHPVQTKRKANAYVPTAVTMRAYEVYSHVHGPNIALITGRCGGGFSVGELIAFLYAYPFPKDEWSARVQKALRGMENL